MSLAMYAAPFNSNNDPNSLFDNENETPISKKRNVNNKTQRNVPKQNYSEKVNSVLQTMQSIQNIPEENDQLADFHPPPPPTSVGVLQTQMRDMQIQQQQQQHPPNTKINYVSDPDLYLLQKDAVNPSPNSNYQFPQNMISQGMMSPELTQNYYNRFLPNVGRPAQTQIPVFAPSTSFSGIGGGGGGGGGDSNTVLLEKLNYMINLLEQHQDEKTQNVTEEIILYSFLGIFLIFIVDSFAKVGKYTR